MASWDDEEGFETEATAVASGSGTLTSRFWADEDTSDDDDVKDSWDDDDNKKTVPTKTLPKVIKKAPPTKGKQAKSNPNPAEATSEVSNSDAVPEIPQQQSSTVEDSDPKKGGNEPIEKFNPKSEKDFTEYAERIAKDLLRPYEKSYHYIGLMKAINKLAAAPLTSSNVKEIVSSMTTVANEKLKAEKAADAGRKKQGAKKKRLQANKAEGQWVRAADDNDTGEDYSS